MSALDPGPFRTAEAVSVEFAWWFPLVTRWRLLVLLPLAAGLLALGASYALSPRFTARTTFLVPQQQSSAAAALASLGSLSGLAGVGAIRTPADQYGALLQSLQVRDRLIDAFDLGRVYGEELRTDVRRKLSARVSVSVGKRDGIIAIEVEDENPERAASMANRHVDELRRLTSTLAMTEAQQRRIFFEEQLEVTRGRLVEAQRALEGSRLSQGTLRADPRAAAEAYATLRAEATAAEVRLQALLSRLSDSAPEVLHQRSALSALRSQLSRLEAAPEPSGEGDYIGRFREFKYQEALFELYARQFELARLDESKEGTLIQVIDEAQVPERKSWPPRGLIAIAVTLFTFASCVAWVIARHAWQRMVSSPGAATRLDEVRAAMRGD